MKSFKQYIKDPSLEEGLADAVGAFGRGFADKATFGGYKYARAAADYGIKSGLKKLGVKGGEDTTFDRELEQEKEKLDKDSKNQPTASALGDIAGHSIPYVPVIGTALNAAKGLVGTAKDYYEKGVPVADKLKRGIATNEEKPNMTAKKLRYLVKR